MAKTSNTFLQDYSEVNSLSDLAQSSTIKYQFVFNCKLKATPKSRQHISLPLTRLTNSCENAIKAAIFAPTFMTLIASTHNVLTHIHTHTHTGRHTHRQAVVVLGVCSANKPKRGLIK